MALYDGVAHAYDRRYALHDYAGVGQQVLAAAAAAPSRRVLELGCGTGRWLALLAEHGHEVAGVDPSGEMLTRARAAVRGDLRFAHAEHLPFGDGAFGAVTCINALHHFSEPAAAVAEAFRVLEPGGVFLSIGLDPHMGRDRWYVYDFFPRTVPLDRGRYPSSAARLAWLEAAGFVDPLVRPAEHLIDSCTLDEALAKGILEPTFTSQLTLIGADEHSAGLDRLREAARADPAFHLEADLVLYATTARKPPGRLGAPA